MWKVIAADDEGYIREALQKLINWESPVAKAAPAVPIPRVKINSGSRTRLAAAPIATESMPVRE